MRGVMYVDNPHAPEMTKTEASVVLAPMPVLVSMPNPKRTEGKTLGEHLARKRCIVLVKSLRTIEGQIVLNPSKTKKSNLKVKSKMIGEPFGLKGVWEMLPLILPEEPRDTTWTGESLGQGLQAELLEKEAAHLLGAKRVNGQLARMHTLLSACQTYTKARLCRLSRDGYRVDISSKHNIVATTFRHTVHRHCRLMAEWGAFYLQWLR